MLRKTPTGYDGSGIRCITLGKSYVCVSAKGHLDNQEIQKGLNLYKALAAAANGGSLDMGAPHVDAIVDSVSAPALPALPPIGVSPPPMALLPAPTGILAPVDTGADEGGGAPAGGGGASSVVNAVVGVAKPLVGAVAKAIHGDGWGAAEDGLHTVAGAAAAYGGVYGAAVGAVAEVVADVLPAVQQATDINYNSGGRFIAAATGNFWNNFPTMTPEQIQPWIDQGYVTQAQVDAAHADLAAKKVAADLHHPDPAIQANATKIVNNIAKGVRANDPLAKQAQAKVTQAILVNRTGAMINAANSTLAAKDATIARLKDRLAIYGDPLSYADTGALGSGPAPSLPQLRAAAAAVVSRAKRDPQPAFLR